MKTLALLALLVVAISCQKETFADIPNPSIYGTWIIGDSINYRILSFGYKGTLIVKIKSESFYNELELIFKYTATSNLITLYHADTIYAKSYYTIVADSITFYGEGILKQVWYKKVQ